jgi:hypothetical protein
VLIAGDTFDTFARRPTPKLLYEALTRSSATTSTW